MLWGCSSAAGLVLLAIVEDKLNAAKYRESWRKKPAAVCNGDTFLFQHNNPSICADLVSL